ncbi:MAG: WbqC family protein, partial [Bacteroidales bacterium]|nr:WbqC family protein [Bacteroidales bacterium]
MSGNVLLSTAYFPPAEYFSLIARTEEVIIERHENYHRQTYRNRCIIMGANGPLPLVVPVLRGSFHKTTISELRTDESKRWRDLHLRGITAAYATAPYFEFYYDLIRDIITGPHTFLIDLNSAALAAMCEAIGLSARIKFTEKFEAEGNPENDYRYSITPKKPSGVTGYLYLPYTQVFGERHGFIPRLSIIDMLLNNGPGTRALLRGSLEADNC